MTARSYFYHLEFELFDKAPAQHHSASSTAGTHTDISVYLPPLGTDIFSTELPEHPKPVAPDEKPTNPTSAKCTLSKDEWPDLKKLELEEKAQSQTKQRRPVIDCGASRRSDSQKSSPGRSFETLASCTPGKHRTAREATKDWRFERIRVEAVQFGSDMAPIAPMDGTSTPRPTSSGSTPTRAVVEPLKIKGTKNTELGWGIVHLYREGEETPELRDISSPTIRPGPSSSAEKGEMDNWDTTILCIPAVPSYMTASDFLGWVGEKTRDMVSHFRMIITGRMNRYMMLMKFRDGRDARRWRAEWDGKVFNGMEPENCHVLFIKSIKFQTTPPTTGNSQKVSFPEMEGDPFTPTLTTSDAASASTFAPKPLPPPTPALVELPTCPVCLERMDETTGLLTILCQHVFHCDCLQKWRGSGCPVCRHIQPTHSTNLPFGITIANRDINLCHTCDCAEDLWICLICGNVGCGRYKGGHAKEHWKQTAHPYALEIETQHVWDYAEDVWVHRLIQTKGDGKLVEHSTSSNGHRGSGNGRYEVPENMELIPRDKLENMGMEYTHMLTSQLESQRIYFEEQVARTVEKAARSAKAAEDAAATAESALVQLKEMSAEHGKMRDEIIPGLERDRDRMASKAEKSNELARSMTKAFQEEKQVSKGLMDRIKHFESTLEKVRKEVIELKEENLDLKEQNRDLSFFISSQDKLAKVDGELAEEIREGTVSVPDAPEPKGKGKKKKGKGKAAE